MRSLPSCFTCWVCKQTRAENILTVEQLTMAYGSYVVMRELSFTVKRGEIKVLMGAAAAARAPVEIPDRFASGRSGGDLFGAERLDPLASNFETLVAASACCSRQAPCGVR